MPNAKKMKNYKHLENCWRWRMGNYRVVGNINDIECIIKIIEISTREDAYGGQVCVNYKIHATLFLCDFGAGEIPRFGAKKASHFARGQFPPPNTRVCIRNTDASFRFAH